MTHPTNTTGAPCSECGWRFGDHRLDCSQHVSNSQRTATLLPPVPGRTLRHANMADLIALLQQQTRQKVDVVIPTSSIRLNGGSLEVAGLDPHVSDEGVTDLSGLYRPTAKVDSDLAAQFGIPLKYVRRLRDEHVGLLDVNVNEWAAREGGGKVLLRLFYGSDPRHPGTNGIARAILSDRYGIKDNLDTTLAVLDGMRAAGLDASNIQSASLSDDNLYLYVEAPEVNAMAPELLKGYRSPFNGGTGETLPIVHAGFVVKNSETGGGALSVTPRLVVRICSNGMVMKKDALRQVHIGGRMTEGQVEWSADTVSKANELVRLQMRDAVSTFLTGDYVAKAIAELEASSSAPISGDVAETITVVAKQLSFTDTEANGILEHFIKGGQINAGGVMHATTSFAQTIEDVDRAADMEAAGVDAMLAAARA